MKFITLNLEEERVENTYTLDKPIKKSKLNGLATVEFSTLNNHLEKYYRLLYKNHKGKWKEFIITSIEMIHTNEGIEYLVYAEDSIVEIKGDFIEDKRNRMATYSACAKKVFEETRWRLITDSSLEKHNLNFYRQSAFKSFNDILQKFSCEYETLITVVDSKVTDRVVHLTNRLGHDLGKRFSWSKDMDKISKKVNEYEVITALYPYGNGEEIGEGYGRRIDISEVNNGVPYLENNEAKEKYGFLNPDGSRRHRFGKREYDTDDKAELKKLGQKDLDIFSKPAITYTATVIDLKNYGIDLDGVDIGDIVSIRDKEANITLRARVLELEEDLDNIEETTIVLGNYRPIFGSSLNNMKDSLSRLESKEGVYDSFKPVDPGDQSFIDIAIENLNKSFNSGTSNIFFDKNRGLVVTDKPTEEDSNWIMELSSQGFRIANSKKSNGEWDFRTFGTGDGFTADQLIAGVIRGGNSFWNLETGELDIGGIFKVDGSGSGSLDPVLKEELRGEKGLQGPEGIGGITPYFHTAYANSADGTVGFSVDDSSDKEYIGQYTSYARTGKGRNISRNGDFRNGTEHFSTSGNSFQLLKGKGYGGKNGARLVMTNASIITPRQSVRFTLGVGETMLVQVKVNEVSGNFSRMLCRFRNKFDPKLQTVKELEDNWKLFIYSYTNNTSEPIVDTDAFGWYNATGEFILSEIKIEKGNTATDWTPAPEDAMQDSRNPEDYSWTKIKGDKGDKGDAGRTPSININADGYWVIDGTTSDIRAEGVDGHTPKLEVSNDGYWVIDGKKSETHAEPYLLNVVYYPGEENPLNVNDISLITLSPNSDTRWIGINNSRRDKYQDWENKSLDMFDWSKFVGSNGSDAIIVSDVEPSDKTKIWRKSITDPNLYIYVDGKWVEVDAQLQDIVVQIQEEISGQEDKWQGDINTNIENVINELTNFQSDLSKLNDELTGKANIEQVLNEEEVKKTVEDIISKYPEIINLNQHFNFGTDGLRITATDASNKEVDTSVLIKNDGLAIEVEGQAAAYFKQNETLTPNLNVEGTAWIGNHAVLGFNGYDADGFYNENKNITAFAWSPRKKEDS